MVEGRQDTDAARGAAPRRRDLPSRSARRDVAVRRLDGRYGGTGIDAGPIGHLTVFSAERSRLNGTVETITPTWRRRPGGLSVRLQGHRRARLVGVLPEMGQDEQGGAEFLGAEHGRVFAQQLLHQLVTDRVARRERH